MIPPEWRDNFAQSDFAEWKKWLSYDAVERPKPEELVGLEKNDVLTFRMTKMRLHEGERAIRNTFSRQRTEEFYLEIVTSSFSTAC